MKWRDVIVFGAIVAVALMATGCQDPGSGKAEPATQDKTKKNPGREQLPVKGSPAPTPPC
jgi:hypothetical protein